MKWFIDWGYMIVMLILITAISAAGPIFSKSYKGEDTIRILKAEGYQDVELTGYKWFTCGKDDMFANGFKATGKNGTTITGCVCSGLFKGNTIRLD